MSWALWLLVPIGGTVGAAVASWLRSRPARPLSAPAAMRKHEEFLDALVQPARSREKGVAGDG